MPSDDDTLTRRYLALVPAAVLLVAGIASFVLQRYVFVPKATDADYRRASAYIMEQLGEDDAIRVYPTWTETPYPYLVDAGMRFVRQDEPVRSDIEDYERIWLITEAGMKSDALASIPFSATPTDDSKHFDTVDVFAVDTPELPRFRYELRDNLHRADVSRVRGDHVIECRNWNSQKKRWDCGPDEDPWIYVGQTLRELGDDPRECIWAHPPPNDYWVNAQFPNVKLGDRFLVRAGPTDHAWRSDRGPEIQMVIEVGEKSVRHVFPPRTQSWTPVEVDTSSMKGKREDVTVRIHANPIWERFFCFNGWAVDDVDSAP